MNFIPDNQWRNRLARIFLAAFVVVAMLAFAYRYASERRALAVFVAPGIAAAVEEIATAYDDPMGPVSIVISAAPTEALVRQLELGGAADVIVVHDDKWFGYLEEQGLLAQSSNVAPSLRDVRVARTTKSHHPSAKTFVAFMTGDEVDQVWHRHGFVAVFPDAP